MTMATKEGERRRSRDSFTLALARIAKQIAEQPAKELRWYNEILHKDSGCQINIKGLWVAGSYARGDLDCGDLDLIIDTGVSWDVLPRNSKISRTLIGRAQDVRFYIGTPEENSSGIAFPEARLIWSPEAPDWQAAIDAIRPDPSVTHYPRIDDELPLRAEQFRLPDSFSTHGHAIERLIDLRNENMIDWTWIRSEQIEVLPDDWSYPEQRLAEYIRASCGKDTQAVMQLVISRYAQYKQCPVWRMDQYDKTRFRVAGDQIYTGVPLVRVECLDDLYCSGLVIAPRLTRRGPNGLWIIWRGLNHPLERAYRRACAFYLKKRGVPKIIQPPWKWQSACGLELFTSKGPDHRRAGLEMAMASGRDLLNLISTVDFIKVGQKRFPICVEGKHPFDKAELATGEDILAVLTNRKVQKLQKI